MSKNMLVDGEWKTKLEEYTNDEGEFQREETKFRSFIRNEKDAKFTPEPNRYHLYISRACPWAHGAALVRKLTGLHDIITMDVLDPYREDKGWKFSPSRDECTPDTVNNSSYLKDIYKKADRNYTGRVTVPVLWDKKKDTIVNNESIEIMKMLDKAFKNYKRDVNLYPKDKREKIDRIIDKIYEPINNGVYKSGFAESQEEYEKAVEALFDALDYWDKKLDENRYLAGEHMTLADVRIFPTLIRFDQVYHTHFKCNKKRIIDYSNLWPYLRDLYQTKGFKETVYMDHIKEHYYKTHDTINPKKIIALGPELDFEKPHKRGKMSGKVPTGLRSV